MVCPDYQRPSGVLALIKSWLEMAVEEDDGKGNKRKTTVNKDSGRGTPQGAPMTPRTQKITCARLALLDQPDDLLSPTFPMSLPIAAKLPRSFPSRHLAASGFLQGLQSDSFQLLLHGGLP